MRVRILLIGPVAAASDRQHLALRVVVIVGAHPLGALGPQPRGHLLAQLGDVSRPRLGHRAAERHAGHRKGRADRGDHRVVGDQAMAQPQRAAHCLRDRRRAAAAADKLETVEVQLLRLCQGLDLLDHNPDRGFEGLVDLGLVHYCSDSSDDFVVQLQPELGLRRFAVAQRQLVLGQGQGGVAAVADPRSQEVRAVAVLAPGLDAADGQPRLQRLEQVGQAGDVGRARAEERGVGAEHTAAADRHRAQLQRRDQQALAANLCRALAHPAVGDDGDIGGSPSNLDEDKVGEAAAVQGRGGPRRRPGKQGVDRLTAHLIDAHRSAVTPDNLQRNAGAIWSGKQSAYRPLGMVGCGQHGRQHRCVDYGGARPSGEAQHLGDFPGADHTVALRAVVRGDNRLAQFMAPCEGLDDGYRQALGYPEAGRDAIAAVPAVRHAIAPRPVRLRLTAEVCSGGS